MEKVSRRQFAQTCFGSLLTFSLVKSLSDAAALASPIKAFAHTWVMEMERVTKAMRARTISQKQWQRDIEALLARVDLKDLLRAIDYDALVKRTVFQPMHETVLEVNLGKSQSGGDEYSFAPFFYAMKKGTAIVPHGHKNMATMHLVLSGEAQALHYDRVGEDRDHILIKPVSDVVAKAGDASTVSDESTNVHWFKPVGERVYMFNVGVFAIDSTKAFTGREYLDPLGGEKESNGIIRARRLNQEAAYKRYSDL